MTEADIFNS
jgi:hypothetical protein